MTGRDVDSRSRRQALVAAGAALAVGIAGCAGDSGDEAGSDGGAASEGDGRPYPFDHPVEAPVEFTSEHSCGVCTMPVLNYADRMSQLAHEDGTGVAFCSPGCLFAYVSVPDHFGAPSADIEAVWVTTFDTGALIDADRAYFALERDEHRSDAPMTIDPEVYEDEAAALEFVDEHEDLDEDDVVGFEAVDEDVARIYRPNRLP